MKKKWRRLNVSEELTIGKSQILDYDESIKFFEDEDETSVWTGLTY